MLMEQFLAARRLVEAGARCVTIAFGFWITTATTIKRAHDLPLLDQGVTALIEDLPSATGQGRSVVVWGEFGRSPVIK